jgi:hypothetical protein
MASANPLLALIASREPDRGQPRQGADHLDEREPIEHTHRWTQTLAPEDFQTEPTDPLEIRPGTTEEAPLGEPFRSLLWRLLVHTQA